MTILTLFSAVNSPIILQRFTLRINPAIDAITITIRAAFFRAKPKTAIDIVIIISTIVNNTYTVVIISQFIIFY